MRFIGIFLEGLQAFVARGFRTGKRLLKKDVQSTNRLSAIRINNLISAMSSSSSANYLEIGVQHGLTFEAVNARVKIAVEPLPLFDVNAVPQNVRVYSLTSDQFFHEYIGPKFDFVFVDGLHEAKQTYTDLLNSLNNLNAGGLILVDDVCPLDYESSLPDPIASEEAKKRKGIVHGGWYGDVYKILGAVAKFHPELTVELVGSAMENHVQALVWRNKVQTNPYHVNKIALDWIDKWTFAECFPSNEICEVTSSRGENDALRFASSSPRF
jgi:hypothetical protein